MATAEEFVTRLYLSGGHAPSTAVRLARRYLAEHGVPPAPLDAATVQFSELGIPIVSTPSAAAMPASVPASPAEAEAIADASGGLVEASEIEAYGLTPREADDLAGYRAAGVSSTAGHDLYIQSARDAFGGGYATVEAQNYARLHGFGLLDL